MLQQFYKETLQSQYIKYILNNNYIPTVPFTSNILHVTKGNTYIHDGYFVTAKVSDAVAAINEDIANNPSLYSTYFVKHEPYIFGEFYNGLTTNYKSNTIGYDSETHYYLGEYLRAYKAHYNIDLMPFYNCYSNEYINYAHLSRGKSNKDIILNTVPNNRYNIISVPIKFCQNYTIALQCNTEVKMLPVFIGKKGILEKKTQELNQLDNWGRLFPKIDFNSPIHFESPHINGVNDSTQQALLTYDRYLRLLIQIPLGIETSIVVLEGNYENCKSYLVKEFNTSQKDVEDLWKQYYSTKIPSAKISPEGKINIPLESTLICKDISKQKLWLNKENIICNVFLNNSNLELVANLKFNILGTGTVTNSLVDAIEYDYIDSIDKYRIPINHLCLDNFNKYDDNGNYNYKIYINTNLIGESKKFKLQSNNVEITIYNDNDGSGPYILINDPTTYIELIKSDGSAISWEDFNSDTGYELFILKNNANNGSNLISIKATQKGITGVSLKLQEYAFYLNYDLLNNNIIKINCNSEKIKNLISESGIYLDNTSILIKLNNNKDDNYYIQMAEDYDIESANTWELESIVGKTPNTFSNYLNQNMISNLSLLKFNDKISYAFCGRLIEYLVYAVIASNEKISKNIARVLTIVLNEKINGIYSDSLRVKTYSSLKTKCESKNIPIPMDVNGFVDKDSEKIITIPNEILYR